MEPIIVHRCQHRGIKFFNKIRASKCVTCRMANVASEMWLQEELVDQMNMKIFEKYRAELEIENSFDEFFEPKKKMEIFIFDSSSKLTKLY